MVDESVEESAGARADDSFQRRHIEAVRAAARLAKVAGQALGDAELTLPQYRVLVFLDDGPRPATQVALLIGVTPSTVTSMVDGLTARALVERSSDASDRRRVMLSLTSEGRRMLDRGDEVVASALDLLLGHLDDVDAEAVLHGLGVLSGAMDAALAEHLVRVVRKHIVRHHIVRHQAVIPAALRLAGVSLTRDRRDLLHDIDWEVRADQRWIVLGANGSGKTTLMRVASLYEHPSRGTVEVLGERLGRTDVRSLRRRVALVSAALTDLVRPTLDALEVVMTARHGALEPWWHTYTTADADRARHLLDTQGVGWAVARPFGSLSSGERQRVLLARALMGDPGIVLLDEPAAGLDLGGREELVDRLDALGADPSSPPVVLVTHHVEEIPPSFTHLLALRAGRAMASGTIDETLDDDVLSRCFDVPVGVARHDGRFSARRI